MSRAPLLPTDSALARLFSKRRVSGVAAFSLPGGRTLFEAGDDADHLYFLEAGKLGAVRREPGLEPQFLGLIRPGQPAGEMAMLAGTPHTSSVVALRDCEVLAMPRSDFLKACRRDPELMVELAQLMILRTRHQDVSGAGEMTALGFIAVCPGIEARGLCEKLAAEISSLGYAVQVIGREAQSAPPEWFSTLESRHDFVLYAAEMEDDTWKQVVGRQVDHLFRMGRGDLPPPENPESYASEPLQEQRLVDLLLLHKTSGPFTGSDAWFSNSPVTRLFHLVEGDTSDLRRLARTVTGQAVGLVLAGGGARAYAAIGAIKALREAKTPIDFVGGSSMGAIVAAGVAMEWDDEEMEARIRRAFVDSSPLDDISFPIIAMTHGKKVEERLRDHFAEVEIADLRLPFFCVSSDLTTGAYRLHRQGSVRRALRASISLPGILPPVFEGDHVLVDGAVTKNFPADIMRSLHTGPIVGVDVTHARGLTADEVHTPENLAGWFASGEWRKGPPIVSIILRSITVSTAHDLALAHQSTDLLIQPDVEDIEIRDWKAFEAAWATGYHAMTRALGELHEPVVNMRRRRSLAEVMAMAAASAEPE